VLAITLQSIVSETPRRQSAPHYGDQTTHAGGAGHHRDRGRYRRAPHLLGLLALERLDRVHKHVRESSLTAHIAVVVVSALPDAREAAFAAGCDAYLMKPCGPDVLYLQLRALMRLRGDSMPA
jgi:hypothetical protein